MADSIAEDTAGSTPVSTASQATRAWPRSHDDDPYNTDRFAGHASRQLARQAGAHGVEDLHFRGVRRW